LKQPDEDETSLELNNEIVAAGTGDDDWAIETVPKTHVPGWHGTKAQQPARNAASSMVMDDVALRINSL